MYELGYQNPFVSVAEKDVSANRISKWMSCLEEIKSRAAFPVCAREPNNGLLP
jgi:hypothetical protein